jgi:hypothetical protein
MIQKCAIFVYLITAPPDGTPIMRSQPLDCDVAAKSAAVENQLFTGTRSVARPLPLYRWWEK